MGCAARLYRKTRYRSLEMFLRLPWNLAPSDTEREIISIKGSPRNMHYRIVARLSSTLPGNAKLTRSTLNDSLSSEALEDGNLSSL